MKKQEFDAELPLGQLHPTIPGLRLIGWYVAQEDGSATKRRESGWGPCGDTLALFNSRGKARAKATRKGLPHSAARPCWVEVKS